MTAFDYARAAITGVVAWLIMEIGSHLFERFVQTNDNVLHAATDGVLTLQGLFCICAGLVLLSLRRKATGLRSISSVWMLALVLVFAGFERMAFLLELPGETLLYVASCSAAMALGALITLRRERGFLLKVFSQ